MTPLQPPYHPQGGLLGIFLLIVQIIMASITLISNTPCDAKDVNIII